MRIPPGKNPPEDINVVIEIPMGSSVKYEVDEDTGVLHVDRILYTAMYYPANYGTVPQTLMPDGDPVDVLVVSYDPVFPGSVINAKPIGILEMEDEEGVDHKVIAVPSTKIDPRFDKVSNYTDLPPMVLRKIEHFFEHYKELEPGKWVKVIGWKNADEARKVIKEAIERFKSQA